MANKRPFNTDPASTIRAGSIEDAVRVARKLHDRGWLDNESIYTFGMRLGTEEKIAEFHKELDRLKIPLPDPDKDPVE